LFFSKNLKYLRKSKGIGQDELADILGKSSASISGYETGRAIPPIDVANEIAGFLQRTLDDMINYDLSDPAFQVQEPTVRLYPLPKGRENILVPLAAQAGYAEEWTQDYINQHIRFVDVPGIAGEARTFEVSGDSMEPVLMHGDYVSCHRVGDLRDIREGKIHVLVTRQSGIHINTVQLMGSRAMCVPANQTAYYLDYAEIIEIWEVKARITKSLMDPRVLDISDSQEIQRLKKLENFIRTKFPDYNPDV
jgi:transcriptional regulator with XRE-family HTH domain